jgi:hypothetical protein
MAALIVNFRWPPLLHLFAASLYGMLFAGAIPTQAHHSHFVDGDPIGTNNATTNNSGGYSAEKQAGVNLGQPAIQVTLSGDELLTEFRVIVFGVANEVGNLRFDRFDYHLDVWQRSNYFAGLAPQFQVDIGNPFNVNLIPAGPNRILPSTQFGNAGAAGDNAPTYDFRFDLANLPTSNPFDSPLAAGEWVFGFQSWHDADVNGALRVSASNTGPGPLPLFSRDSSDPRGILGGQDPNNISVYWGISLAAIPENTSPHLLGDFSGDGLVSAADYVVWRDNLGASNESALKFNGDGLNGVDIGDYQLWRRNYSKVTATGSGNAAAVAEPANAIPFIIAVCGFALRRARPTVVF